MHSSRKRPSAPSRSRGGARWIVAAAKDVARMAVLRRGGMPPIPAHHGTAGILSHPNRARAAGRKPAGVDGVLHRGSDHVTLVEIGTSDETKALHLLSMRDANHGRLVRAYVAIDVAAPALEAMRVRLRARIPISSCGRCRGFRAAGRIAPGPAGLLPFGFFAGSTIGNFDPARACAFLRRAARTLGVDSALLVGFDLRRTPPSWDRPMRMPRA